MVRRAAGREINAIFDRIEARLAQT